MKKITALLLALCTLTVVLCGCGSEKEENTLGETALYNYSTLSKYIELGKYKNISVDLNGDDYLSYLSNVLKTDAENAQITETQNLPEGTPVENGDTVIIDYSGTKDGVAFEGGTATDTELEIGSNSFIPGFESGLVGVKVGDSTVLDLTFPEQYQAAELAGQKVKFAVTVKSATRSSMPEITDEIAQQLGYNTAKEYKEHTKNEALQTYLLDAVNESSTVLKYPSKEVDYQIDTAIDYYKNMAQSQYNMSWEDFLKNNSMTEDTLKSQLEENVKPTVKLQLVCYAIARKEKMKITDKDRTGFINKIAAQYGASADDVKSQLSKGDIEYGIILDKVNTLLVKSAKTK